MSQLYTRTNYAKSLAQIDDVFFYLNIKNVNIVVSKDPTKSTIYSIERYDRGFILSYWNTATTFSCTLLISYVESGHSTQSQIFEQPIPFIKNVPGDIINGNNGNKIQTVLNYFFSKKIPVQRINIVAHNYKITEYSIAFKGDFVRDRISFLLFYSFKGTNKRFPSTYAQEKYFLPRVY